MAGCTTLEQANRFLRERYRAEFNRRFQVPAGARQRLCLLPASRSGSRLLAAFERAVNRDNTVSFENRKLQVEPVGWRGTLAGCSVTAHQHLDGTLSLSYGPQCLGRYGADGVPLLGKASTALSRGRGTAPFPCNPIPKPAPPKL